MLNLVGQTLDGKYRVERELGRGGMGAVYFAFHLGTKRPVAVKVIVPQFMRRAEFIERFKREAEAAGRLRHPNVVNVTDFGFAETLAGQAAYLVMEYLDGCTLGEVLQEEKKLSLRWTVDILEQVSSAVDEAHRQGIVHRDLKPDNIWLEPNERGGYTAKVLDFGIARLEPAINDLSERNIHLQPFSARSEINHEETAVLSPDDSPNPHSAGKFDDFFKTLAFENQQKTNLSLDLTLPDQRVISPANENPSAEITRVGAILGTPPYMSPEQCRAERLSGSSDIYSLGVIAYEMLSGRPPFSGENISVIAGHLQLAPPALRRFGVPRKVKKVIYQALSKEPIERPPTAEIFAGQLRSFSEGVVKIFSRAAVIFIENFSKLIWFSLLLYLPTIFLAILSFVCAVFEVKNFLSPIVSKTALTLLETINIAVTVAAETLITGAVLWIVVQFIDTPLRSFSVWRALLALFQKWRQFAWLVPVRIVIALFTQSSLLGLPAALMFALSIAESLFFWCLPCVVMMEKFGGINVLKRGWTLTRRALPTIFAALILNLILFTVAAMSVSSVVYGFGVLFVNNFMPAVNELSIESFNKLMQFPALIGLKIIGVFVLPFFGVVTALLYLKTRYAGGESTKTLLAGFERANIAQSVWQQKIRRRLEQSGRLSNLL